jgi:small subunit ribosomal protein S16
MVRIRLSRMGRKHRPFYRINAIEKRNQRDGKVLENLGWYNPVAPAESEQVSIKEDRVKHWLGSGAQPSDTCKDLFVKAGILDAEERQKELEKRYGRRIEKMKAEAEAKRKAEEEAAKAEAEAKAKEEAEAKAKAEAEAAESSEGDETKSE